MTNMMKKRAGDTDETPGQLRLSGSEVALAAEDTTALRRFTMLAYTGAVIDTWFGKYVLSIAGMRLGRQKKPILLNHDENQIVGHSVSISKDDAVNIDGVISGSGQPAKTVVESSENGFPWQASVGLSIGEWMELDEKQTMTVNGVEQRGPMTVVTKSTLLESSFVPMGADSDTSAIVLSRNGTILQKPETTVMPAKTEPEIDAQAIADEAVAKARAAEDDRIGELRSAFSDRPDFVVDQIAKGHDVLQAKAELADIQATELSQARDKEKALVEQLKVADRTNAQVVGTADAGDITGDDEPDGSDVQELAEWEWKQNTANCKQRFRSMEGYVATKQAEANGMLRTRGNTVVALDR